MLCGRSSVHHAAKAAAGTGAVSADSLLQCMAGAEMLMTASSPCQLPEKLKVLVAIAQTSSYPRIAGSDRA